MEPPVPPGPTDEYPSSEPVAGGPGKFSVVPVLKSPVFSAAVDIVISGPITPDVLSPEPPGPPEADVLSDSSMPLSDSMLCFFSHHTAL